MMRFLSLAVLGIALTCIALPAHAATFTADNTPNTYLMAGMNDPGLVVGTFQDQSCSWNGTAMTPIADAHSRALCVNNLGTTGTLVELPDGEYFQLRNASGTILGTVKLPAGVLATASLNNLNQWVGSFVRSDGVYVCVGDATRCVIGDTGGYRYNQAAQVNDNDTLGVTVSDGQGAFDVWTFSNVHKVLAGKKAKSVGSGGVVSLGAYVSMDQVLAATAGRARRARSGASPNGPNTARWNGWLVSLDKADGIWLIAWQQGDYSTGFTTHFDANQTQDAWLRTGFAGVSANDNGEVLGWEGGVLKIYIRGAYNPVDTPDTLRLAGYFTTKREFLGVTAQGITRKYRLAQ